MTSTKLKLVPANGTCIGCYHYNPADNQCNEGTDDPKCGRGIFIEEKEMFVIFVKGGHAPTKTHSTYEEAEKEAKRLLSVNRVGSKATIAKLVATFSSDLSISKEEH